MKLTKAICKRCRNKESQRTMKWDVSWNAGYRCDDVLWDDYALVWCPHASCFGRHDQWAPAMTNNWPPGCCRFAVEHIALHHGTV